MQPSNSVLADIEEQAKHEYLPIVGSEQAEYLEWLIREQRPCTIVDAGTMTGYAAIRMARNLQDGCSVTGIEIANDLKLRAEANISLAGLSDKIQVRLGDAAEIIGTLVGPIDLLFLDSSRSQYLQCLRRAEPKLSPGALIVANGTGLHARLLTTYLAYVRESSRYESDSHAFGADAMEVSRFLG